MWKHTNEGARAFGRDLLEINPATGDYAPGLRENAQDRPRPYNEDHNPADTRDISLEAQKKLAEALHLEFREKHGVIAARSLPLPPRDLASEAAMAASLPGPGYIPLSLDRHQVRGTSAAAGCNLFAAEIQNTTFTDCSFNSTMLRGACLENVTFEGKCSGIGMHLNQAYLKNVDARGLRSMRGGSLDGAIIGPDTTFRGVDLVGVKLTNIRFEVEVGGQTTVVTARELLQKYEEGGFFERRQVKNLIHKVFGKCQWGNAQVDPDLKSLLDKFSKSFDGNTKHHKMLTTASSLKQEIQKSLLFDEQDVRFDEYSDLRSRKERLKMTLQGSDAEIELTFASSSDRKKKGYLENQVSIRALNLDFNHLQRRELMQQHGMFFEGETPDEIADREKRLKAGEDVKAPRSIIRFKEHFTPREAFEVIAALMREGYRERKVDAPPITPSPSTPGPTPPAPGAPGPTTTTDRFSAAKHFLSAA